ncbi:MAG: 3-ketoacyl-ACP reductase [Chitinivibrionales bacterium]|nr:3-ketoacyl-ACP reductase [Chitinivibrionales bacterium]
MSNKIALITGGLRGIGLGITRSLVAEGYSVAACGVRKPDSVSPVVESLENDGAEILYTRADISDSSDRRNFVDSVKNRFGRCDVLVNNAGVAPLVRADILEATEESFERVMKINLQGPYFLTQCVAQWMIEQKKAIDGYEGCIINISSISATVASPSRGEYCISKAGIGMATLLWATRLGEFGIPVYEIRPGLIQTDMTVKVRDKYDKLIGEGLCVQPRWGFPEDVGKAAASLVRGDFPYSTGQVIMIDGGMTIGRL